MNRALILSLLLGSAVGCRGELPRHERVVLEIADEIVTVGEFDRFVASSARQQDPALPAEVLEALFEQFVEERLLLRAATDVGITVDESSVARKLDGIQDVALGDWAPPSPEALSRAVENQIRIERLVADTVLDGLAVSDEEIAAHYEASQAYYERPETVDVSQILVEDESLASELHAELASRPVRFEELAREHSVGPEAELGGRMGRFALGELPPSLEEPVFALRKGRLSDVVPTDFGYHIFRLNDRIGATLLPLEEVEDAIRVDLLRDKSESALAAYLDKLRRTYPVVIHRENLAAAFVESDSVAQESRAPVEANP